MEKNTPLYDTKLSVTERAKWLVSQMTIEEKFSCFGLGISLIVGSNFSLIRVPSNILLYAQEDYYEPTPQAMRMLAFLKGKVDEPEFALQLILDTIKDVNIPMTKAIPTALENIGYAPKGMADIQKFTDLFTDLSNNTRMPSNRGFTPNELFTPGLPKSLSFGPGIQEALRSGALNGDELKKSVFGHEWPAELKNNIISEIDRALKPGEEKWVGGTLVKGQKIRPNDPCPCGSGKKYKKCCGKKN